VRGKKLKEGIGLSLLLIALFFAVGSFVTQAWAEESYVTAITPVSPDEPEDDVVTSPDGSEGTLAAIGTGKIIVINESSSVVNVFLDGDLIYSDLEPGYTLTIRNVNRGRHELYAETSDGKLHWGPIKIRLRRKFTWTLTD